MAFESLGDKFQRILKKVKGQAKLTEKNMEDMLREVRIALLEGRKIWLLKDYHLDYKK